MPNVRTQPKTIGDLLLVEVAVGWTKEKALFAAASKCQIGTVLARIGGKVQPINPAGTAAEKKASAISLVALDTTEGERPGSVIARGAAVAQDALVWPEGITEAQISTALADLEARGIVASATL